MTDMVGFIGLGSMGAPMAGRLVGWPGGVMVYDVRDEATARFAGTGADIAAGLADIAAADIVSVAVLDDAQVREVVADLAGHAAPGTVIAIHSTIGDSTAA